MAAVAAVATIADALLTTTAVAAVAVTAAVADAVAKMQFKQLWCNSAEVKSKPQD